MSAEHVGVCSRCGQDARWNTPYMDSTGKVVCHRCAGGSKELLVGLSQQRTPSGELQLDKWGACTKHNIVLWTKRSMECWAAGGETYRLDAEERAFFDKFGVEALLDRLHEKGKTTFRCTSCGGDFPNEAEAGRPLFAGRVCGPCWQRHLKCLERQRAEGAVCSFCKQPYGLCAC